MTIVGHERAVELLCRALETEQLSHAYLFSGPESVGKRTLALEFAQALLCLDVGLDRRPCGVCPGCKRFVDGAHPDVRLVELDAEHVQISRKEIGQIQSDAALKPLLGQRKVYVLIEIERLSAVAGNQLLKLLEEPPPGVFFLLTTGDLGAVLPTILSRCQVVRLQPVPRAIIETHLVDHVQISSDTAALIGELADGRIGWAIRAGKDPALIETRERAVQQLLELLAASRLTRLLFSQELAGRWSSDRAGVIAELDWWTSTLRDLAVCSVGAAGRRDQSARLTQLRDLAGSATPLSVIEAARAAQRTARLLEQNVNPRLALDTLVLDLPVFSHGR